MGKPVFIDMSHNRENPPKGEWMRRLLGCTTYGISEFSIKWNKNGEGAIAFI